MIIDKIFSNTENPEENLYSVLMTEDELRLYTKYDETDSLKRMKDADILAEKKKSNAGSYGKVGTGALKGAGLAGALGTVGLGAASFTKGGRAAIKALGRKGLKRAAIGLVGTGAAVGAGVGLAKGSKERKENNFYNRRLKYAQRNALRRESADWKNNNLNRAGYTQMGNVGGGSSAAPSYE